MANRRMLSRTVSTSEKLGYLFQEAEKGAQGFGEFAQLLYTWMMPQTDDWGRMSAGAWHMKMSVMPSSPRSIEHFDLAIKLMHNSRLIAIYGENKELLQVENFDTFQSGLINKRTESKFQENISEFIEFPITSKNFSELPGITYLTKLNLTKPNPTKPKLKKKVKKPETPPSQKTLFLNCVYLEDDEHKKLVKKFGDIKAGIMISEFNTALMSKKGLAEKYKSHYFTILNWERRNNGTTNGSTPEPTENYPVDLK